DIRISGVVFFIILMIIFCRPKDAVGNEFRYDFSRIFSRRIYGANGLLSHFFLSLIVVKNYRPILLANIRSLPVQLGGIMSREKNLEQRGIVNSGWIVIHFHRLCMAGPPVAYSKIGRASCRERA